MVVQSVHAPGAGSHSDDHVSKSFNSMRQEIPRKPVVFYGFKENSENNLRAVENTSIPQLWASRKLRTTIPTGYFGPYPGLSSIQPGGACRAKDISAVFPNS